MKTLALLSQKGGTGKTTLALHLAVAAEAAGQSVVLLDLDPQASSKAWSDSRTGDGPTVETVPFTRIAATLKAAGAAEAGLVVLDSAPHSDQVAMAAARAADLILIPFRAGVLDIRAVATSVEIARMAGKPTFAILNAAPVRAHNLVADAQEAVKHHGVEVAPFVIHQRSSYSHALTDGRTAAEFEPDGKAAEEIAALYKWLAAQMKI